MAGVARHTRALGFFFRKLFFPTPIKQGEGISVRIALTSEQKGPRDDGNPRKQQDTETADGKPADDVLITSVRTAAQEQAERSETSAGVAIGIGLSSEADEVEQFTRSAAYRHALDAYVEAEIDLHDLACAVEPLRAALPWMVESTQRAGSGNQSILRR